MPMSTVMFDSVAVNVFSARTSAPPLRSGEALPSESTDISAARSLYSRPTISPVSSTVSVTPLAGSAATVLSPSASSAAVVATPGTRTVTVWAASSTSAWAAISRPDRESVSKATICTPSARLLPSKAKTTSTDPSAASGVKVVSATTSAPFASRTASPVALSTSLPAALYSRPGMQPL